MGQESFELPQMTSNFGTPNTFRSHFRTLDLTDLPVSALIEKMVNPLAVVILPVVYILVSVLVCLQLSVVLSLLGAAAVKIRTVPQLAQVQPGVCVCHLRL
jgi:hypothetical protein